MHLQNTFTYTIQAANAIKLIQFSHDSVALRSTISHSRPRGPVIYGFASDRCQSVNIVWRKRCKGKQAYNGKILWRINHTKLQLIYLRAKQLQSYLWATRLWEGKRKRRKKEGASGIRTVVYNMTGMWRQVPHNNLHMRVCTTPWFNTQTRTHTAHCMTGSAAPRRVSGCAPGSLHAGALHAVVAEV